MNGVSLFICGDIVNYTKGLNFVGTKLASVIKNADYAICNFEGPELRPGQTASCPHQEPGTAVYLKEVGFDLMLLANNHITELGIDGVKYSIDTIRKTGADCMGAGLSWTDVYKPIIKNIRGRLFAFLNVCEAQVGQFISSHQEFGYAWIGRQDLFSDVLKLSKEADYLIVFVHAGLEHYPIPLPEIREFYHRICDSGACCVIGGHPHSAQGYEYYGDKFIAYSLGNFYFPHPQGVYESENTSYSIVLNFGEGKSIEKEVILHSLRNDVVNIETDPRNQIDINALCDMLGPEYDNMANEMCVAAYHGLCQRLLAEATCGEIDDMSRIELLKSFVRRTLFRRKYVKGNRKHREELLLRLFENETYRYTIIRALKAIKKNENSQDN